MDDKYQIAIAFGGESLDELGVNSVNHYREKNQKILSGEIAGSPLFSPIYEHPIPAEPKEISISEIENLSDKVLAAYRDICNNGEHVPGKFGDFIQIYKLGDNHYQMLVSKKAYHKPALAADLAVVLKGNDSGGNDKYMLVTGTRKAEPGKGKPAWLGGFANISKNQDGTDVLDSFAYTLLHEGQEEAGLRIEHSDPDMLQRNYMADNIPVVAYLGPKGKEVAYDSEMINLGLIATSDLSFAKGGERYDDGQKRVHLTNGFCVMIDLKDERISDKILSGWLTAGDDIDKLQFHDITGYVADNNAGNLAGELEFGIQHHNDFVEPVIKAAHNHFINQ